MGFVSFMNFCILGIICYFCSWREHYARKMTIDQDIEMAVKVLKRGGVILYPTDTVWGIGCDATNSEAVKRIYAIKQRADNKAMIVLLSRVDDLWRYIDTVPEVAPELIEAAVRPLTVVYDRGINMAPELMGPDGSVGVRVTREKVSAGLCKALRRPIVSTSANVSGQPAPAIYREIAPEIVGAVDYVMESRRDDLSRSKPSQVIKLTDSGVVTILRK